MDSHMNAFNLWRVKLPPWCCGMSMLGKVCPRCGMPFSYVKRKKVGGRVYLYAIHKSKGKVTRECYLGPVGGYEYVSKLHEDLQLQLSNVIERDWVEYVRSMVEARVELAKQSPSLLSFVVEEVREVARIISEAASRLKLELSTPELQVELKAKISVYTSQYGTYKGVQLEHEGESTIIPYSLAQRLCKYGVARSEFCSIVEKLRE